MKVAEKVADRDTVNSIHMRTLDDFAQRAKASPEKGALLTRARAVWKKAETETPSFQGPTRLATGEKFVMRADLPSVFFGPDDSPHNPPPVQQELFGAATCFAGGILMVGAQEGLDIDELCVTVESDVNFTHLLTDNEALPASPLRVKIETKPDDPETLAAVRRIAERATRYAPGVYMLANPMSIALEVSGMK